MDLWLRLGGGDSIHIYDPIFVLNSYRGVTGNCAKRSAYSLAGGQDGKPISRPQLQAARQCQMQGAVQVSVAADHQSRIIRWRKDLHIVSAGGALREVSADAQRSRRISGTDGTHVYNIPDHHARTFQ